MRVLAYCLISTALAAAAFSPLNSISLVWNSAVFTRSWFGSKVLRNAVHNCKCKKPLVLRRRADCAIFAGWLHDLSNSETEVIGEIDGRFRQCGSDRFGGADAGGFLQRRFRHRSGACFGKSRPQGG